MNAATTTVNPSMPTPTPDTLERAYRDLRHDVRRFVARRVRPDVVDDLTQEIFLKMHEHAGDVRDVQRLGAWLFRIARGVVVDHHRRLRREASLEDAPETPADEDEEATANINEEVATWVRPMLTLVPPEYARALELAELEGITQRELAERLGLSLSGAKSRVQRGRKLLEGVLRACCDFELDPRGNVLACTPRGPGQRGSEGGRS